MVFYCCCWFCRQELAWHDKRQWSRTAALDTTISRPTKEKRRKNLDSAEYTSFRTKAFVSFPNVTWLQRNKNPSWTVCPEHRLLSTVLGQPRQIDARCLLSSSNDGVRDSVQLVRIYWRSSTRELVTWSSVFLSLVVFELVLTREKIFCWILTLPLLELVEKRQFDFLSLTKIDCPSFMFSCSSRKWKENRHCWYLMQIELFLSFLGQSQLAVTLFFFLFDLIFLWAGIVMIIFYLIQMSLTQRNPSKRFNVLLLRLTFAQYWIVPACGGLL
jgi:hypothetical protein